LGQKGGKVKYNRLLKWTKQANGLKK